jgi:hypothetical protein
MEKTQPLEPVEDDIVVVDVVEEEETRPMPFGVLGISFLSTLTTYAAYLGITILLLMIIRIFGPS